MTNHKEILRLKSLGLSNKEIAAACGCGRNTVTRTLQRAQEASVSWEQLRALPPQIRFFLKAQPIRRTVCRTTSRFTRKSCG